MEIAERRDGCCRRRLVFRVCCHPLLLFPLTVSCLRLRACPPHRVTACVLPGVCPRRVRAVSSPLILAPCSEHGSWTRFDRAAELAAEAAFGAGHATAQSSFFNPRLKQMIVYDYDLKLHQQVPDHIPESCCLMPLEEFGFFLLTSIRLDHSYLLQVNTATGYIRKIKRDAPGAPGAAALGGAHAAAAGAPGAAKKAKAGKKPKPPETIVYNADVMLGGADSFDNVTKCKVFQVSQSYLQLLRIHLVQAL